MRRILIRCDASISIGSGHTIRCRTLARKLQSCGADVTFLCRRQSGDLISVLEKEFSVVSLPEQPLVACNGLEGRDLYAAWLGCTQEQDASQCLQALAKAGMTSFSWLIADHYGLDATWEKQLLVGLSDGDEAPRLLVIDDLADRPHESDVLLDQNFFGEATDRRYQRLVPPQCLQLLGPHYALLGQEYAHLHPLVQPRTELRRVLVFFGGVDSSNVTVRALKALTDSALADLAVDVVLGLQSPNRNEVAELVARRPNTTLHEQLPSLAGLIARADVAIGAGGATTWERACLGLSSLVVAIAGNQLAVSEALDHAGYIQLLGDGASVTEEQIRSALLSFIDEPKLGKVFPALTDGWGASRLAMAMLGCHGQIHLRQAIDGDEALLLRWANDPRVRINSFSLDPIALVDDPHWFQKKLENPNHHLLIATTAAGCPIGQIGLDVQAISSSDVDCELKLTLSIDRCAHSHGLVSEMVRLAFISMEQHWGAANDAASAFQLLSGNKLSNPCFVSVGFNSESEYVPPPPLGSDLLAMPAGNITLLSDRSSWLNSYLSDLIIALWNRGHAVRWIHNPSALHPGDVCLLLSCGSLLNREQLALHQHNLVVHASALPEGRGWSPMSWQILEGCDMIPITLFEAVADLDDGPIYLQQQIALQGHELVEDWRLLLVKATHELCLTWFDRYLEVVNSTQPQHGDGSYYSRRRPADSQLNPEKTLAEQFNLLRVADNMSYPAFFNWRNNRYDLFIRRS